MYGSGNLIRSFEDVGQLRYLSLSPLTDSNPSVHRTKLFQKKLLVENLQANEELYFNPCSVVLFLYSSSISGINIDSLYEYLWDIYGNHNVLQKQRRPHSSIFTFFESSRLQECFIRYSYGIMSAGKSREDQLALVSHVYSKLQIVP